MAPQGFDYEKRSYEDTQERATQRGSSFDSWIKQGVPTFKPAVGLNTVRFIPIPGSIARELKIKHYAMDAYIHYNVGGDRNSYPCLEAMKGTRCPVCEYRRQLEDEKADKEDIREVQARKSVLAWVIDRNEERAGPKLWPMSYTLDKQFSQLSMDVDDKTFLAIEDPNEGFDVTFHREGQALNTKYSGEKIARKASYLCREEAEQDRVLNFVVDNPINEVIQYFSAEEIDATMNGKAAPSERRDGERSRDTGRDGGRDDGRGSGREGRDRLRDRADADSREPEERTTERRRPAAEPETRRSRETPAEEPAPWDSEDPEGTYRDTDGALVDSKTGEVLEGPEEAGRREANRTPAGRETERRRPAAEEPPPPRGEAGRAGGRVSDPPPETRAARRPPADAEPGPEPRGGSRREPPATEGRTTERRRPAAEREPEPRHEPETSTERSRSRLDGLRGRR